MDWLYDRVFVRPYYGLANLLSSEPLDRLYELVVSASQKLNQYLSDTQTGRMRSYVGSMIFGLIFVLALSLGVL